MKVFNKRILKPIGLTLFILALLAFLYGFFIEPNIIRVRQVKVKSKFWPEKYGILKLALIADTHTGSPFNDINRLKKLVEMTNNEKPDIVFLLGDYVIEDMIFSKSFDNKLIAKAFGGFKSKYGTFAVMGNHDWDHGEAIELIKYFRENGITVLENSKTIVKDNKVKFQVAGNDGKIESIEKTDDIIGQVSSKEPVIFLTHYPKGFNYQTKNSAITLAGHNHGGQLVLRYLFGGLAPAMFLRTYRHGLYQEGDNQIFVTAGVGTSGIPLRFGAKPEIVIIELE